MPTQPSCYSCGHPAHIERVVPYSDPRGRGAEWAPFCRACNPTAERWPARDLGHPAELSEACAVYQRRSAEYDAAPGAATYLELRRTWQTMLAAVARDLAEEEAREGMARGLIRGPAGWEVYA